jgi:hypothetical protein
MSGDLACDFLRFMAALLRGLRNVQGGPLAAVCATCRGALRKVLKAYETF